MSEHEVVYGPYSAERKWMRNATLSLAHEDLGTPYSPDSVYDFQQQLLPCSLCLRL